MKWDEQGGISEVFCTTDSEYSFQRCGNWWNLYHGQEGTFLKEFRSFSQMQEYIRQEREKSKGI